ncbi:hypothetical protein NW752_009156 [Fusarium irregulare]|uniref:NACHT-NTPase and P-loop NTPases N-terminal domain-containing protein n=1 Tax=Fusarium irregulare TaxID=2494466 RepID=A0A9W8PM11_9HYPO|nr:hypothetical protein NW766_008681 [Fusarium irregulare]KAJ4009981.1 hypothetical protein NW752_009156 [Fusarium irregulare]
MYTTAATKPQVLRSLDVVLFVHSQAVDSCSLDEGSLDIPQAFYAVSKHLPIVGEIFRSVKSQLRGSTEETEQTREMYLAIKQVADDGCAQLRALDFPFDTMTQEGNKMERYASAVKSCDGKKVENIMVELLTSISLIAVEPFVSQEEKKRLLEGLEEVKKLPPSLEGDRAAGIVLNNSGSGNQFYHGGKGNQNHCSGGFQVNGDNQNARYAYAEKSKVDET